MLYFIGWSIFFIFIKFYLGLKVVGRKNVPKKGAFIFVSNHVSYLDPIILGTSVYRSLNYMARENLFSTPRMAWAMRGVHAFPVKRSKGDLKAIKQALAILKENKPLVIFPEGTRSKDKNLKRGKPGVGFIVSKAKVPVVPAYIEGSFDALPRNVKTLKRRPIKIYIGEPIKFDTVTTAKRDKEIYQKISDEVMDRIAALKEKAGR